MQFASFGDSIYAACFDGTNGHFVSAATPSTNFATFVTATAPVTYSPLPRYVSTIKNHLLIANVESQTTLGEFTANTVYPNLVMWSATDNPARWGDELTANYPETVGSSYQQLYDEYGPITGLCGGMDYAYIFKPRAIYRMDGPEWTFHPVVTGAGTVYPNSIVRFYNDVYFWGPCGPARLRYGSSEVENIGLGKVQRAITDSSNLDFFDYVFELDPNEFSDFTGDPANIHISAAADTKAGVVAFFVADQFDDVAIGFTYVRSTMCIVYDVATGNFSALRIPSKFGFVKSAPRYGTNPFVKGAINWAQAPVLDGFFGVGVDRDYALADSNASVMQLAGDGDVLTTTISGAEGYLYDWFPKFTTAFNPLALDDQNGPITTRVRRVRVPFTLERFGETVVDGYASATYAWSVKVNVTVRTKNRYAGETEEVTGSWTSSDSYQPSDGWIDLNGGKGSTAGEYHQFEIEIVTLSADGTEVNSIIVHLRDLTYFEVEFDTDGPCGSTYIA